MKTEKRDENRDKNREREMKTETKTEREMKTEIKTKMKELISFRLHRKRPSPYLSTKKGENKLIKIQVFC